MGGGRPKYMQIGQGMVVAAMLGASIVEHLGSLHMSLRMGEWAKGQLGVLPQACTWYGGGGVSTQ